MYILVAFVDGVEVEPIKREVSKVVYTWRNKDWWFPPIMAKNEKEKTDWLLHKWEIVIWLKLVYDFLFFFFRHFIEEIYSMPTSFCQDWSYMLWCIDIKSPLANYQHEEYALFFFFFFGSFHRRNIFNTKIILVGLVLHVTMYWY